MLKTHQKQALAVHVATFVIAAAIVTALWFLAWFLIFGPLAGVAHAQDTAQAIDNPASTTSFWQNPVVLGVLAGTVVPILTGLVTRVGTDNGVKAAVSLFFSAVLTGVNLIITNEGDVVWTEVVLTFAVTYVSSVASFFGFWSDVGSKKGVAPLNGVLLGEGSPG